MPVIWLNFLAGTEELTYERDDVRYCNPADPRIREHNLQFSMNVDVTVDCGQRLSRTNPGNGDVRMVFAFSATTSADTYVYIERDHSVSDRTKMRITCCIHALRDEYVRL